MKLTEKTIIQGLKKRVNLSGNKVACIFDDIQYTWCELDLLSDLAAEKIANYGVKKGEHVGLLGINTMEWLVCYYAIHKIGAVAVLLNYGYLETELKNVMEYADVAYLAFGESKTNNDYAVSVGHMQQTLPQLKASFDMNTLVSQCLKEYKDRGTCQKADWPLPDTNAQDTAVIIFTSGTTLKPKGVLLSHGQLMTTMGYVTDKMGWQENDRLLLALPMYHGSGGNTGILASLHCGMSMVIMRYYRSVPVMQVIEKYHCTVFNAVPSMLLLMIKNPEFKKYDLSFLRTGIISGSTISDNQYQRIAKAFKQMQLVPAYGMTEGSTLSTICDVDESENIKMNSAGRPLENVKIRIWNCQKSEEAAPGEVGEIQICGETVMQGYYHMPEKTMASMMEHQWFRTGDAGYMDTKGYLYFKNRITEMIIRGGENISPLEIEQAIRRFDEKIDDVKVVGIPDLVMQEEVAALVTMREGSIDVPGLKHYLKEHLALFKVPKYVYQIEAFPMTGSGKIDLKKTRAIAEQRAGEERKK